MAPKKVLNYHSPKSVRGIDPLIWRRFQSYSVTRGITIGELLNRVIEDWMNNQVKRETTRR